MTRYRRGDTIVEVILAFAVFALVAVATTYLMNRSLSVGQRSLEITLVRQQIDSQADLLRYVRDVNDPVWSAIKSRADSTTAPSEASFEICPNSPPSAAFVLNIAEGASEENDSISLVSLDSSYQKAAYYSRVDMETGSSNGLWIIPVKVTIGDDDNTYDMYIQACWDSVGSSRPQTMSTIVRLYDEHA
jgi:hypothetical protein